MVAFSTDNEDIHMNVEALLTQRIGPAGKRLHTARSRNDQVAVDLRLLVSSFISSFLHGCLIWLLRNRCCVSRKGKAGAGRY